jgi:hypothetical protein
VILPGSGCITNLDGTDLARPASDRRNTRAGLDQGDIVRRGHLGIIGLLAVVALAGCSSATSDPLGRATVFAAAPGAKTPGYVDALTAKGPVAGKIGPVPLLTAAQDGDLSVAWRLIGMSPDTGQLWLKYVAGDGSCYFPAGFSVKETGQSVTLTAMVRKRGPGSACRMPLNMGSGYLDLKAPLGDRKLIHAEVDPAWSTID